MDEEEEDYCKHYESLNEECRPLTTGCKLKKCKIVRKYYIGAYLLLAILTCLIIFVLIYLSLSLQSFSHGAVATDSKVCSQIGINILQEAGGNAVDAAIASTVCMCVIAPEKTGFGGGGIAMVYNENYDDNPLVIDFATNTISGIIIINYISTNI